MLQACGASSYRVSQTNSSFCDFARCLASKAASIQKTYAVHRSTCTDSGIKILEVRYRSFLSSLILISISQILILVMIINNDDYNKTNKNECETYYYKIKCLKRPWR